MTSCFVYKIMGHTFHDIRVSSSGSEEITKQQQIFLGSNHWLLFFFIQFFFIFQGWGRGGSDFIILFLS